MKARLSAPPTGQTWKTYYYAGSQLIALRVLTSTGEALYYLHSDHLGSTSLTTDNNGAAVGGVITVTTPTPQSGAFGRPAVAAESDGESVVVWTDQDRAGLQRLMASGAFIGGAIVVDDDVNAEDASVAYGADDNSHLVAWIGVGSAYARVFRPVDADFSASPVQGSAPLTVTFTNLSKPAASMTSYLWNFGDGYTSTITNPVHTYTQTGYFTVTLKAAAGSEEETITRTNLITVTGGGAAPSLITTTIVYTYDPLYRLTGANYSSAYTYTFAYRYDAVGNRTVQTRTITSTLVTTYTYDIANRLATQNGQSIFTWDANGNLKADGSATYGYDFENRLISTTLNGVTTQFAYNGDGIRLRLIESGTLTTYTQDYAAPLPVVLQAKTGSAATQYIYSLGTRPIGEYEAATWEYLLADPLGSVRQIANAGGNVTLLKSYEPYGSVLNSEGSAASVFGYAGEQLDATGLIFLRARYYQTLLGLFLSRDAWPGDALRPGSMNGWNYGGGDPINRVDPSGWQCQGPQCPVPPPTPTPPPPPKPPVNPPPQQTPEPPAQARPIEEVPETLPCALPAPPNAPPVPCNVRNPDRPTVDGYILGLFNVTMASPPTSGLTKGVWPQTECNTYGTSMIGAEIVYDFRHQEQGYFEYRAAGESWLQVASGSVGIYRGFAKGFRRGVGDYGGNSVQKTLSANLLILHASAGSSVPFNKDGTPNPEGVYATFFGTGIGGGLGAPVSLSTVHANYTLRSLKDYNGKNQYSETLISVRRAAADRMAQDIRAAFEPGVYGYMANQAIDSLYKWVNYR